jgi:thymidylate synthase ThyX
VDAVTPASVEPDTRESGGGEVNLVEYPEKDDINTLAALIFRSSDASYSQCRASVLSMSPEQRKKILLNAHRHISAHDPILREFELGMFTFELVLSASAFAQLKRHRMATLIAQDYNPELGFTIPPNIERAAVTNIFEECLQSAQNQYDRLANKLKESSRTASNYILTNAHRRRVIMQANARELTHFSRLREDMHAQWDIRRLSREMIRQAREACPALMMFACGKDKFDEHRSALYPKDNVE